MKKVNPKKLLVGWKDEENIIIAKSGEVLSQDKVIDLRKSGWVIVIYEDEETYYANH